MTITSEPVVESERNRLLRRVDWRFLIGVQERPPTLVWAEGDLGRAAALAFDPGLGNGARGAGLVVLSRPTPARLSAAWRALAPGGEMYCEWRLPRPAGLARVRAALNRAGYVDIRLMWAWPPAVLGPPQFWLPLDSPEVAQRFAELRPRATSRRQAVGRRAWPVAQRLGLLAPVGALARRPGGPAPEALHGLTGMPTDVGGTEDGAAGGGLALLTGGRRAVSKVVGMPVASPGARWVVKFARVPEADDGLAREARVLETLAERRALLPGIPKVLGVGQRAGRTAVVESAVKGVPLLSQLTPASFPRLAAAVTEWLTEFAGGDGRVERARWDARMLGGPVDAFAHEFGAAVGADTVQRVRSRAATLGDLPRCCEHRDCSPWNVLVMADGRPALVDWESAEPDGLPGLDLTYFLANCAFILEGALESGRTRETYARLLDPATSIGRVAASCFARYSAALGIAPGAMTTLRLLCWVVHSRSEHAHATADAGGVPASDVLRRGTFVGLVREELARA